MNVTCVEVNPDLSDVDRQRCSPPITADRADGIDHDGSLAKVFTGLPTEVPWAPMPPLGN